MMSQEKLISNFESRIGNALIDQNKFKSSLESILKIIDSAGTTTGELAEQRQEIRDIIREALGHDD